MSADSLNKRYFFKLLANVIGACVGMITQALIPRGLGPKSYGDFNFLTKFFTNIVNFFDMGSSLSFYTKISQRPEEIRLKSFYLYFAGVVSFTIAIFVLITHFFNVYHKFWPAQSAYHIYLAVLFVILVWLTKIMSQISDAYGLTVKSEITNASQKIIGLLIIALLFIYRTLNIETFFFCNYFIAIAMIAVLYYISTQYLGSNRPVWRLTFTEVKGYLKEFYFYSHPLFICNLVGMVAGIFDIWLLQIYGGSIQQASLGLGNQIGIASFLFAGSLTPLFIRELSIAFKRADFKKMSSLFRRYAPLCFSVVAFFSCFIALQAEKIVNIFAGKGYEGAVTTVAILAFYPVHQTYGQLSSSVFFTSNQNSLYRNINILYSIIGLPVSYFLIAPVYKIGLGMGSVGLALKIVGIQILAVNTLLYFNSKFLKFSFWRCLGHQLFSLISFLVISYFAAFLVGRILNTNYNSIVDLILSGVLYSVIVGVLTFYLPAIFGLNKDHIVYISQLLKSKVPLYSR